MRVSHDFSTVGMYQEEVRGNRVNSILLWDVKTGTRRCTIRLSDDSDRRFWLSADGKRLATVFRGNSGTYIQLMDTATGAQVGKLGDEDSVHRTEHIAFSPTGHLMVSVADWASPVAHLWDIDRSEERTQLNHKPGSKPRYLAFSPDGKYVTGTIDSDGKSEIAAWRTDSLDNLWHTADVTEADASDIGKLLYDRGYLQKTTKVKVVLSRRKATLVVSLAMPTGACDDPTIVAAVRQVLAELPKERFSRPIAVNFCTGEFEVKSTAVIE